MPMVSRMPSRPHLKTCVDCGIARPLYMFERNARHCRTTEYEEVCNICANKGSYHLPTQAELDAARKQRDAERYIQNEPVAQCAACGKPIRNIPVYLIDAIGKDRLRCMECSTKDAPAGVKVVHQPYGKLY